MKNAFFALAFMLIGSFAFASNGEVNDVVIDKEVISEVISISDVDLESSIVSEEDLVNCTIPVTVISDAGTYEVTYNGPCEWGPILDFLSRFF